MRNTMSVHDTLVRARDLLLTDGWCTDLLRDDHGRHCAIGAVCEVIAPCPSAFATRSWWTLGKIGDRQLMGCLRALADQIPADADPEPVMSRGMNPRYWGKVAYYNNTRHGSVDILAMFDAAIVATADDAVGVDIDAMLAEVMDRVASITIFIPDEVVFGSTTLS